MSNEELTSKDVLDMLTVLLERTSKIDDIEKKIENMDKKNDKEFRDIKLSLNSEIKPDLQAIRENQTEVIKEKSHITGVETKVNNVKDDVDVLKIAIQEHSKDIEKLKKRA